MDPGRPQTLTKPSKSCTDPLSPPAGRGQGPDSAGDSFALSAAPSAHSGFSGEGGSIAGLNRKG